MNELVCLLDGREVDRVNRIKGRLSFVYARSWRSTPGAYPLSLSMPLAGEEHPHSAIEPFLWGLLPDDELVLQRWATSLHISPRSVFGLIAHVGEDCAGAVQFMTAERSEQMQTETAPQIDWLTDGGGNALARPARRRGRRPCSARFGPVQPRQSEAQDSTPV